MSFVHAMELCRLCLVKENVLVPIFGNETLHIFNKIRTCLPVKVTKNDKLPKKICCVCLVKIENVYQFYNSIAKAEKQLLQWLEESEISVNNRNNSMLKTEQLYLKEEQEEQCHSSDLINCWNNVEAELGEDGRHTEQSHSENCKNRKSLEIFNSESDYSEPEQESLESVHDEVRSSTVEKEQSHKRVDVPEVNKEAVKIPSSANGDLWSPSNSLQSLVNTIMHQYQMLDLDQSTPTTETSSLQCSAVHLDKSQENIVSSQSNTHNDNCSERISLNRPLSNTLVLPEEDCLALQLNNNLEDDRNFKENKNSKFPHLKKEKLNKKRLYSRKNKCVNNSSGNINLEAVCELCGKYVTRAYLKQHVATHSAFRPYKCDQCKKTFKLPRLLTLHKKIHLKHLDFICKFCGYMTYSRSILLQHERRHTNEDAFKCEICARTFSSKYHLHDHRMLHSGTKPYRCEKCGKAYHTKGGLYIHLRTHHDESHDNEELSQGEYCDICGKTVSRLRRHRKTHRFSSEREEYKCDVCGKCVTSRSSLTIHLRIHTGEKPYPCDICGKSFADSRYLLMHVRSHTGERPYTCEQCGKSFTQRGSLRIHKMTHSGQKPYKCNMCDKAFITNTLLKSHTKAHQMNS